MNIISLLQEFTSTKTLRYITAGVYLWFGIIFTLGFVPATTVMFEAYNDVLSFMSFGLFYYACGVFCMLIGISLLVPRLFKMAKVLLAIHILTALSPLICAATSTWHGFLLPTLYGEFAIKSALLSLFSISILPRDTLITDRPTNNNL